MLDEAEETERPRNTGPAAPTGPGPGPGNAGMY